MDTHRTYAAFGGERLIAAGELPDVLGRTKKWLDRNAPDDLLIFDERNGRQVEFDFRGTLDEVLARELASSQPASKPAGPGRPRLGVVSREVSLLPAHWAWLEEQPNGISAALRRLVVEASKREPDKQHARRARDAVAQLMTSLAGNRPGFEEALRALYAKDRAAMDKRVRGWPKDIRQQIARMLGEAAPSS